MLPAFGVRVYVCSYYFSSVWVAEWTPLRKELPIWLTICSICTLTICFLVISRFGFDGGILGSVCSSSWALHTCYFNRIFRFASPKPVIHPAYQ